MLTTNLIDILMREFDAGRLPEDLSLDWDEETLRGFMGRDACFGEHKRFRAGLEAATGETLGTHDFFEELLDQTFDHLDRSKVCVAVNKTWGSVDREGRQFAMIRRWVDKMLGELARIYVPTSEQEAARAEVEAFFRVAGLVTTDWIVEGLLERGCSTLKFGVPGAGKTLFATTLAFGLGFRRLSAALGLPETDRPFKVAIWSSEQPSSKLKQLMAALNARHGADKDGFIPTIRGSEHSPPDLTTEEGREELAAFGHGHDVVILDTVSGFAPREDTEGFKALGLAVNRIKAEGAAVLLLHHPAEDTRKGGRWDYYRGGYQWSRGGGKLVADVDYVLTISKPGKDVTVSEIVPTPKFRGRQPDPIRLRHVVGDDGLTTFERDTIKRETAHAVEVDDMIEAMAAVMAERGVSSVEGVTEAKELFHGSVAGWPGKAKGWTGRALAAFETLLKKPRETSNGTLAGWEKGEGRATRRGFSLT
ncbi:AAA family ATPase [Rhodobacterales bacterium HKCCSP123]|nr:AAA family ATPase [Rhodobacterales bacterium HKCCSP123]